MSDDDAWSSIVENFGERARLSDDELVVPVPPTPAEPAADVDGEHYIPPEAPRVGLADGPRGPAWLGLIGAPTLFVITLLTGLSIPEWLALFAVVAFVFSLGYLVATMHRAEDDDPSDDGARV